MVDSGVTYSISVSEQYQYIQCRLMLSLTHKHQRHTSHNTAGRAPQGGTERRAPESGLHIFSWPMSLCMGSAEQDKETDFSLL